MIALLLAFAVGVNAAPPTVGICAPGTIRAASDDAVWCERGNKKAGPFIQFDESGRPKWIGEYRDGAQHGTWLLFSTYPRLHSMMVFENGKQVGTAVYVHVEPPTAFAIVQYNDNVKDGSEIVVDGPTAPPDIRIWEKGGLRKRGTDWMKLREIEGGGID